MGRFDDDDDVEEGKQRFLVYDFMPNGALEDFIFRGDKEPAAAKPPPLTWAQRRSIIMDVARGLEYLHHGVKPAIYHRDIKATNILLDGEMRAIAEDLGDPREPPGRAPERHPARVGAERLLVREADRHEPAGVILDVLPEERAASLAGAPPSERQEL